MPEDIERITKLLSDMKTALDIHIAVSQDQNAKTDNLYKDYFIGNGTPSLKHRVAVLEEHMPDKEDWIEIKNWVKKEKQIIWTVLAAVITQTIILFYQMLK